MNRIIKEEIPHIVDKNGRIIVKWRECIGIDIPFEYEGIKDTLTLLEYNKEKYIVKIKYKDKIFDNFGISSLTACNLGVIVGKINYDHIYNVGDIVNEQLEILEKIDIEEYGRVVKGYRYKCIDCCN